MLKYLLSGANKGEEIPYEMFGKLVAGDGAANDYFGNSVSISGDGNVVLVGAYVDDDKGTNSGSAYIFTTQANGSYIQAQKLLAIDGARDDFFGASVSISGDGNVALVGAQYDDDKGGNSGSAYIFTKQANGAYLQTHKLVASDGAVDDAFGSSVSISSDGNVALIGSPRDDDKGADSGSAYIFTTQADGSYTQTSKLVASDGAAGDSFGGVSISGDGNVALVGAYRDSDNGSRSGSAYIFTKQANGSYTQTAKLLASDGVADDFFGGSVSISDDGSVALVGAIYSDNKNPNSGSAYIFTKQANGAYSQTHKLVASDGARDDYFGSSVSISSDGSIVVVGTPYYNGNLGSDFGSAYIFTKQTDGAYKQTQILFASDGAASDNFGNSIAISGDGNVVLVGAQYDDDKGTDSGSAHIFK